MLTICRKKLREAAIAPGKVVVDIGDITECDLGATFDLVIAPYRVLQNLETDGEVAGFFRCVRTHLAPGGTCILNVFRPRYPDRAALVRAWSQKLEELEWERTAGTQVVTCHHRRGRIDPVSSSIRI